MSRISRAIYFQITSWIAGPFVIECFGLTNENNRQRHNKYIKSAKFGAFFDIFFFWGGVSLGSTQEVQKALRKLTFLREPIQFGYDIASFGNLLGKKRS